MKKRCLTSMISLMCMVSLAGCSAKGVPSASESQSQSTETAASGPAVQADKIAEAAPVSTDIPAEDYEAVRDAAGGLTDQLAYEGTRVLAGDDTENHIWSPVNVSLALAMLAESAGGSSRQEILDALDVASIEDLRKDMDLLWPVLSYDNNHPEEDWDGGTCLPANSLWMSSSEDVSYNSDVLQSLAETYHASAYTGEMGSEPYNKMLQDWLNEQTQGLLADAAGNASFDPRTVMGLVSTIYYHANWAEVFDEEETAEDAFYAKEGESTARYMTRQFWGDYYRGEHFGAVSLGLVDDNIYWILLPDEGYEVADILSDPAYLDLIKGGTEGERADITLKLPKYDITADTDLKEMLQTIGIAQVFDEIGADFSPLFGEGSQTFLSKAEHAARMQADEKGVTAAAYTMFGIEAAGVEETPQQQIDFICDHPFVFAVTDRSLGLVMFEGVVNRP